MMASIQPKKLKPGQKPKIVQYYRDANGKRKQKWHTCENYAEAMLLLPEIEKAEREGRIYIRPRYAMVNTLHYSASAEHREMTVKELVEEFIERHCAEGKWEASTLSSARGTVGNYLYPYIGNEPIKPITTYYIQQYYDDLLTKDSIKKKNGKTVKVSPRTVKEVDKILSQAFDYAVRSGLRETNPTDGVTIPQQPKFRRVQWTIDEVKEALENCDDPELCLMISLMISGPMRTGEMLALSWPEIIFSEDDTVCQMDIRHELKRLRKDAVAQTKTEIHFIFPDQKKTSTTSLYLKGLKTEDSKRIDYLPPTVHRMLRKQYETYLKWKKEYEGIYPDYGLVFHQLNGRPISDKLLSKRFRQYIKFCSLKDVEFYSLRHSGATSQMAVSGNNIKAVQANMGHATPDMLMSVYAAPVEEQRRDIALRLEDVLFSGIRPDDSDENEAKTDKK